MPTLIVIGPNLVVREYGLSGTLSIGRHESNGIQLSEEKASRMHCSVRCERGQAFIEDLNSANGVFVNGLRVTSQQLRQNDRITIGATTIVYCETDSPEKWTDTKVLVASISSEVNAIIPDSALAEGHRPGIALKGAAPLLRPDAAVGKSARPPRKAASYASPQHALIFVIGFLAAGAVGLFFLSRKPDAATTSGAGVAQSSEQVHAKEKVIVQELPSIAKVARESEHRGDETPAAKPETPRATLEDQLKTALAERDRALGNGNLLGAKAAVQAFLSAVPPAQMDDESARRARSELAETVKVANAALEMNLVQAQEALDAKHFHLVAQRCTNLISNDPRGPYGAKAHAMLERIDEQTAQAAASARTRALDAIARGQIGEARAAVESVMGALAGTRWAGDIDMLHMQLLTASDFLEKVEAARAKKTAAGEPVPLALAAKKIEGTLASLNGLQGRVRAGQADLPFSLKNVEPKDFIATLDALELSNHHAELACLWSILGRPGLARAASEAALKKPGNTPGAAALAGLLASSKNLHLYDFKSWRQQSDWEAVSGSWLTQDGRYVLETPDGGETFLKPAGIGGPFPLAKARVAFEFEILKPSAGWFFVCEIGNEKQAVLLAFSQTDAVLQDKTGLKSPAVKWSGATVRAAMAIDGDTVTLQLNGKPAATLTVDGILKQSGTITFQARQCGCAIGNLMMRSAGPD